MSKGIDYKFPVKLTGGTPLEYLINCASESLSTAHILFAPHSFKCDKEKSAEVFYDLCLFGIYAESLMPKLRKWAALIDKYFTEYEGSWEFYARSERLEMISEYGGEDGDYNSDGTVKTKIKLSKLTNYSIISEMIPDWVDIIQDTTVSDMNDVLLYVKIDSELGVDDIMKIMTGKTIPSYRQNEKGVMEEISWAEKLVNKISKKENAAQLTACVASVVIVVQGIISRLKELKKNQDNTEALKEIRTDIDNLIDFKPQLLSKYFKTPF